MGEKTTIELIQDNKSLLDELQKRRIFLIIDGAEGVIAQDLLSTDPPTNPIAESDASLVETLLTAEFLSSYPFATLFDLVKAVNFLKKSQGSDPASIKTAWLMSRINFMGTDGLRGKISTEQPDNYLGAILKDNQLTPALIKNCAASFATLLLDAGILQSGDKVCFGNDGRDVTTNGKFTQAVIDGFTQCTLDVLDLGKVPTPFVPYKMLREELNAGSALTASHNPANQNGIKFFLHGKKLLPEGKIGDYTLSAYIFSQLKQPVEQQQRGNVQIADRIREENTEFMLQILPGECRDLLSKVRLVFDTANGAYAELGMAILDRLGLQVSSTNPAPDGYNINQNCGVSELENQTVFSPDNISSYNSFVQEVFRQGRQYPDQHTFGMAVDGDGDRGYILFYDKSDDQIHVLDGDKAGFILAQYFIKHGASKQSYFVSTIESDLMTSTSAATQLGLQTKIVSVGDKWICNFDQGELCVGLESSGHLIYPLNFETRTGKPATLLAGNGLLTCLAVLTAIEDLGLDGKGIYQPFVAGFSKTMYRFFIDKAKFHRDSAVWNEDKQIIEQKVAEFVGNGALPKGATLCFEDKEDRDILYGSICCEQKQLGCVISRNSGTEDKTAVYVLGVKENADTLLQIGKAVNQNHLEKMKNHNRIETTYETAVLDVLSETPQGLTEQMLKGQIEKKLEQSVDPGDFNGVLHGLKKEARITVEAGRVHTTTD